MATVSTLAKNTVQIRLNNGTDSSGSIKTVGVTFPALAVDELSNDDLQKVMNIVNLYEPVSSKTVNSVRLTKLYSLTVSA